jgi:hypothetical protein
VTACLKAAGITVPTAPARAPSGSTGSGASGAPAGSMPAGTPPSGSAPTGSAPTGAGGGGAPSGRTGTSSSQMAKIQAALKACGITVPSGGRPGGSGGAS